MNLRQKKIVNARRALMSGRRKGKAMATNGDATRRTLWNGWKAWKQVWDEMRKPIEAELTELRGRRQGIGAPGRQHRASVLRAQVRMLYKMRVEVRRLAREDQKKVFVTARHEMEKTEGVSGAGLP